MVFFTPELQFCVNRLNVKYNPQAPPPKVFLSYLRDLLETDDIITLQEYLGYILIPSLKAQAMLSIIGKGGEGKSVLGKIIEDLFGNNMTEGKFHKIETNNFFRANLAGKLVFVDDDLRLEKLPSTEYIKSLVTIEIATNIERKYQQSYCEKLYARFFCFGNKAISSQNDKTHGFSRRMIILSTKSIPKDRIVNPSIAEEIIVEKEGVFNWMFAGLMRLLSNNFQFSLSAKTKLNISEMSRENCNIIEFLYSPNVVAFSKSAETSSKDLYACYSRWCKDNEISAIESPTFISWVRSNEDKYNISYSTHVKKSDSGNVRGFKGVAIIS